MPDPSPRPASRESTTAAGTHGAAAGGTGRWRIEHRRGSAAELHHAPVPSERTVLVCEVSSPALVLGSTQSDEVVDHDGLAARGVQLARRRSGGGAVLLVPGEHVWVDVVLPAHDARWRDDVEAATWWLGAAWAAALGAAPGSGGHPDDVEVHRRGVSDRELGALVCFAAAGPGEVSVAGRKVVGISQRRTRQAARFQCVVHRRFDADATWQLLSPAVRSPHLLDVLVDGVGDLDRLGVVTGWDVVEGLLAHLG